MSTYGEGNVDKVLIVTPNGAGGWETIAAQDDDPMLTLVRRFGRADTAGAATVTGNSTLHTPTSGKSVRLKWIYLASPKQVNETVATVKLGVTTAYVVPLPSPSVFMRTSIRHGAVDAALTVDLSVASTVYANYELEEF